MPGDLAWRLPGSGARDNLQLFYDAMGIAGFAWFEPVTGFEFDLRHDLGADLILLKCIIDWAEQRRLEFPAAYPRFVELQSMSEWREEILNPRPSDETDQRFLTTITYETDDTRVAALTAAGYQASQHYAPQYRLDLNQPIDTAALHPDWSLRPVSDNDIAARVELHRAAWLKSSFSVERYQQIRDSPIYRADLDIILDTGDSLASYCICWADPVSRIGIFEPVGTRTEWRGQGVARAVINEGLRRLKAIGMNTAQVSTACFNAPAQALYESCGFKQIDRARTYVKCLDD